MKDRFALILSIVALAFSVLVLLFTIYDGHRQREIMHEHPVRVTGGGS